MTYREKIRQTINDVGGKLRVRSALNPVLWLCAIVTIPTIYLASSFPGGPPLWLIIVALTPLALAGFGFLFLLFFDRDKLQSEEYQIRKRSLELIQEKGNAIPMEPTSLNLIANPEILSLPPVKGGDGR